MGEADLATDEATQPSIPPHQKNGIAWVHVERDPEVKPEGEEGGDDNAAVMLEPPRSLHLPPGIALHAEG